MRNNFCILITLILQQCSAAENACLKIYQKRKMMFALFGSTEHSVIPSKRKSNRYVHNLSQNISSINRKLINNLLRQKWYPDQLFYIQPYFKDLFTSIQKLQPNSKINGLQCFRGALINEVQMGNMIQNVGQFVQNLSFMSTSLSKQVAELFMKNVLYVIDVHFDPLQSQQCYGFADISKYSEFYSERQILFNPLNYFKIKEVGISAHPNNPNQIRTIIYLSFVQSVEEIRRSPEQANDGALHFLLNCRQNQLRKINCQGDALLFQTQTKDVNNDLRYWQKYCQICQSQQAGSHTNTWKSEAERQVKHSLGLWRQAQIFYNKDQLRTAIKLYKKSKILSLNQFYSDCRQHIASLLLMAECYRQLNQPTKALKIYQKCGYVLNKKNNKDKQLVERVQIHQNYMQALLFKSAESFKALQITVKRILSKYSQSYLNIVNALKSMAFVNLMHNKYEKALKYYNECLQHILKMSSQTLNQNYVTMAINKANCLTKMGKVTQATQIYGHMLNPLLKLKGLKSYVVSDMLFNYAKALNYQGEYELAISNLRLSSKICNFALGKTDLGYVLCIVNFAIILYRNFLRFSWALRLLKYCRNIVKRAYGPQHYMHFRIMAWIAGINQTEHTIRAASHSLKAFADFKKFKQNKHHQSPNVTTLNVPEKGPTQLNHLPVIYENQQYYNQHYYTVIFANQNSIISNTIISSFCYIDKLYIYFEFFLLAFGSYFFKLYL